MSTHGNGKLARGGVDNGVETAVRRRYAEASRQHEDCLCVPSNGYDAKYLAVLPEEIVRCDYGCGDPSRFVLEGETVLDLGSGSGKVCYICAQIVGPKGRVIGVDFNQPMLDLARKHQKHIAETLGLHNTSFRKGKIQDLQLDLDEFEEWLAANPVSDADGYLQAQAEADRLRQESPMIPDHSIDVIVSNCVLNLVTPGEKRRLFGEMFRVLKVGGRCVISDIVCDEDVPEDLQKDPQLWSGCISGAFREDLLLKLFEDAGFYGIQMIERTNDPWQTIRGIEFRSVTVQAFKGKQGPCFERNQAVIYKGPWRKVTDDDGHVLERGRRAAVCDKTFRLYQREPYRDQFYFVEPREPVAIEAAKPFDCRGSAIRHPRQTKGLDYDATTEASKCCGPDGCC
ncbi:MAG: methyltransferase domain-containing protein [Planctomycetota bacterium]|nr:methyltransferase domain-containing protein [Planctomycetota bacterium]